MECFSFHHCRCPTTGFCWKYPFNYAGIALTARPDCYLYGKTGQRTSGSHPWRRNQMSSPSGGRPMAVQTPQGAWERAVSDAMGDRATPAGTTVTHGLC